MLRPCHFSVTLTILLYSQRCIGVIKPSIFGSYLKFFVDVYN